MATSAPGALSIASSLSLISVGNAIVFPLGNAKRLALTLNGLTGSGATLAIDGSRDQGVTWATTNMPASDFDTGAVLTTLSDDADYRVVTHGYTHAQVRVVSAGTASALVLLVSEARAPSPLAPTSGGSSGPNPAQDGTDATGVTAPSGAVGIRGWLSSIFFGIGTPTDTPWASGAGTLVALGKAIVGNQRGVQTVTINGALPAGTNFLGYFGLSNPLATYAAPTSGSVTTAASTTNSAPLIAAGAYANVITITTAPTSTGNVFLGFAPAGTANAAVAGSGFVAFAGGGSVTLSRAGPLPMPAANQAIYAISDNGTVAVSIQGA